MGIINEKICKNYKYKNILKGSYKRDNIFIPKSKIVRKFKVYKD